MVPCKGLFWMTEDSLICCKVPCDLEGNPLEPNRARENNHRQVWKSVPRSAACGKPYNYYPRGRVEIRHSRAVVYLSPHLCNPSVLERIKTEFSLSEAAGIAAVSVKGDGSRHYRCYLDDERS